MEAGEKECLLHTVVHRHLILNPLLCSRPEMIISDGQGLINDVLSLVFTVIYVCVDTQPGMLIACSIHHDVVSSDFTRVGRFCWELVVSTMTVNLFPATGVQLQWISGSLCPSSEERTCVTQLQRKLICYIDTTLKPHAIILLNHYCG